MTTKRELRDALQRCVIASALRDHGHELSVALVDAAAILARPARVVGYVWRRRDLSAPGSRGERWIVGKDGDEANCKRQARNWCDDIGCGVVRKLVVR